MLVACDGHMLPINVKVCGLFRRAEKDNGIKRHLKLWTCANKGTTKRFHLWYED